MKCVQLSFDCCAIEMPISSLIFPDTVITELVNTVNCFVMFCLFGLHMIVTPLRSFLHSPKNVAFGSSGLLD